MMHPRQTFGLQTAYHPPVIGLAGKRHVGKTTAANYLVECLGFARVHPLDGGKVAAVAYFEHLGAPPEIARRMAFGDLRDQPSPYLPDNALPRLFLEKFGRFMGVTMGSAWTLGKEMERVWRVAPLQPLVVESVVYEPAAIRAVGGKIVRIVRPDHDGPAGVESDSVQAAIEVDAEIVNDGDIPRLLATVHEMAMGIAGG
jgi:hypothetical protein